MKIALGTDHAGIRLKEEIMEVIRGLGHEVEDLGVPIPWIIPIMPFRCARRSSRVKRTAAF